MGTVYAGTSGWAYPSWRPGFYPRKLSAAKFLSHYASRLNSVEVNYTFRHFPSRKLPKGWIRATPAGFKFAVKAHQSITYLKRLRGATRPTSQFIASLKPLHAAGKLGLLLFQLPPNLKCDLRLLNDFLTKLPRRVRAAFEFRHTSWFIAEVFDALRKANVALCLAESPTIETPDVQTTDFFYLRLRKESYSAKARQKIATKVTRVVLRGDVFAYFMHKETPESALYAERLLRFTNLGQK